MKKHKDIYSKDGNSLIREDVQVEWVDLNEGLSGEYRSDNPADVHVLRFNVSVRFPAVESIEPMEAKDVWILPNDCSCCTNFPASTSIDERKRGLKLIMDRVYNDVCQFPEGRGIKKICEELSLMNMDDIDKKDYLSQGIIYLTIAIIYVFMAEVAFMIGSYERSLVAFVIFVTLAMVAYLYIPLVRASWKLNSDIEKIRKSKKALCNHG
ncbi:MAG: hypothetical protein WC375_00255 [Methanomassiliicoccales archaeon]|jgi:hypothetical protein